MHRIVFAVAAAVLATCAHAATAGSKNYELCSLDPAVSKVSNTTTWPAPRDDGFRECPSGYVCTLSANMFPFF